MKTTVKTHPCYDCKFNVNGHCEGYPCSKPIKWKEDFEAELLKDCKKCGLTVMCTPSMCKFRKTPKEILGESHG